MNPRIKFCCCSIIMVLLGSCATQNKMKPINIVVYGNILNPQTTYDSIANSIKSSGLVDSVKIIGNPIRKPSLVFEIDTPAISRHHISYGAFDKKIKSLSSESAPNELRRASIINKFGQKIPLSEVSKIYSKWEYYLPQIFKPTPDPFYFRKRKAVKIELYGAKRNKKVITEFMTEKMTGLSGRSMPKLWEFEIVQ